MSKPKVSQKITVKKRGAGLEWFVKDGKANLGDFIYKVMGRNKTCKIRLITEDHYQDLEGENVELKKILKNAQFLSSEDREKLNQMLCEDYQDLKRKAGGNDE